MSEYVDLAWHILGGAGLLVLAILVTCALIYYVCLLLFVPGAYLFALWQWLNAEPKPSSILDADKPGFDSDWAVLARGYWMVVVPLAILNLIFGGRVLPWFFVIAMVLFGAAVGAAHLLARGVRRVVRFTHTNRPKPWY